MSRHQLPCRNKGHELFVGHDGEDKEFYGQMLDGGGEECFSAGGDGAIEDLMAWAALHSALGKADLARLRTALLEDAAAPALKAAVARTTDWRPSGADAATEGMPR